MKKYILGAGLVTAALVPAMAVVACNDDSDAAKADFIYKGANEEFKAWYNNPTDWKEKVSYDRSVFIFKKDSAAMKELFSLKDADGHNYTIETINAKTGSDNKDPGVLDTMEIGFKEFITGAKESGTDFSDSELEKADASFKDFVKLERDTEKSGQSQITIGTFPSVGQTSDDMIGVAINSLSKDKVKKLISLFKVYVTNMVEKSGTGDKYTKASIAATKKILEILNR